MACRTRARLHPSLQAEWCTTFFGLQVTFETTAPGVHECLLRIDSVRRLLITRPCTAHRTRANISLATVLVSVMLFVCRSLCVFLVREINADAAQVHQVVGRREMIIVMACNSHTS